VRGLSDAWTTTKIQSKYFIDSDVKGHRIDVDTRAGVVTLKGTVETEAQKTEAAQIARETEGVKQVVNQLTVRPDGNR
jgi:osmotically-inducible protein OsmY